MTGLCVDNDALSHRTGCAGERIGVGSSPGREVDGMFLHGGSGGHPCPDVACVSEAPRVSVDDTVMIVQIRVGIGTELGRSDHQLTTELLPVVTSLEVNADDCRDVAVDVNFVALLLLNSA